MSEQRIFGRNGCLLGSISEPDILGKSRVYDDSGICVGEATPDGTYDSRGMQVASSYCPGILLGQEEE